MTERELEGGITNTGQVVRSGPHVLRPSNPQSESIHAFLRALRDVGFDGAPLPVGIDDDGRERLEFVEGDVPLTPYPEWCQSDAALASAARLLRGLHDAARSFDPDGHQWNDELGDPRNATGSLGATVLCHNDAELSNIVFRNGLAVAFIDFEFAAPGRPIYDLAQLARFCVPIEDDFDQARMGWRSADRAARLRLVADAYGLSEADRGDLLGAIEDAMGRIEALVRGRVEAGDSNVVDMMNQQGGMEKFDRRRRWWVKHVDAFTAALR